MQVVERLIAKLETWLGLVIDMVPNLLVAVLVVVVFGFGAKWIARGVARGLGRFLSTPQLVGLVAKVVRIAIVAAGAFAALDILHLDKAVTSLLAGVGIVGLALGFAFQDIAANFVSGVLMAVRRPFAIGDLIEVDGHFGHVDAIDLRATVITRLSGETVIIPNKDVFQNALVNYTKTHCRRVDVAVGVSYGDDLELARRVAMEAVEELELRDRDREIELFYTGFGGSSIDMMVRIWIHEAEQGSFLRARSDAIMAVKAAFDREGITIPFPIRTLDFGVVGGERLADHLQPVATEHAA
ncbi:MAG: mechanosensitive ion channel family protein [Nannocystaceae bacterium]